MYVRKIIRNYEYWPGNNQFFCQGYLMFGPKGLNKILLIIPMITIPFILSLLFSVMINNNLTLVITLSIILALIFINTIILLLLTEVKALKGIKLGVSARHDTPYFFAKKNGSHHLTTILVFYIFKRKQRTIKESI